MKQLISLVIIALTGIAVVQADTTDIYQPMILTAGVKHQDAIERRIGSWGFGFSQVAQENLPANMAFNFSGRYFVGERWYALAAMQLAEFSDRVIRDTDGKVLVKENVTSVLVNGGIGYELMQGSASFSGENTYPWQLGVEGYLGEQFTGDSSGTYIGMGMSWQLVIASRWLALEWKNYQINDDNLVDAKVNKGMQWGISFGSYF